ncbi:hypothetical protein GEV33_004203 [Tenebrio molitor]|uniref:Uncharacterized protein n=1 Tax=Tenebrio molitor TaxID=7067 RepID=A0A8J6LGJ4_TENMO|nr:hypothetical protein GEV33_004203 [Tenebrio molitor]
MAVHPLSTFTHAPKRSPTVPNAGTDFGDSSGVPRSVPWKTPAFFQNLDAEPPSQCVPSSA